MASYVDVDAGSYNLHDCNCSIAQQRYLVSATMQFPASFFVNAWLGYGMV